MGACIYFFAHSRSEKNHPALVWTGMGMAPSAVSNGAASPGGTLCPPVWVASRRGGGRGRGPPHQSRVTQHLCQGLEAEASGQEE